MLTSTKLITAAVESFNKYSGEKGYDRKSFLTGFYDGYLFNERSKPKEVVKKKVVKKKPKTTTGKLAEVGVKK